MGNINQSKISSQILEILIRKRFSQNICYLFICQDILYFYDPILYQNYNIMVLIIKILNSSMKYKILSQYDATMAVKNIKVGSRCPPNRYVRRFLSQTTSFPTSQAATYSSSTLLKATRSCFVLIHEIMVDPKLKHPLVVLLPSVSLPPQSEFVKPTGLTSLLFYFRQWCIVPRRYLNICLAAIPWSWWFSN